MTYIGEEFQKRFKALPPDIQEALTAVASVDTIFAIGKKHGLMVDQIGTMADEIWKVMLGLANPKDFIRNLASALGIESEKASAIASEVNTQMFQPVRESLRRLYDEAPQQAAGSRQQAQQQEHFQQQDKKPTISYQIPATSPQVPPMIYPHTKEFGVGVYPQDRFEEEFKKEPAKGDGASSMYHVAREKEEKEEKKEALAFAKASAGEPEQLAPLVPATSLNPLVDNPSRQECSQHPCPPPPRPTGLTLRGGDANVPPLKVRGGEGELHDDDFTYPEKTKEISRESTKGREYQRKDPYRESIEE